MDISLDSLTWIPRDDLESMDLKRIAKELLIRPKGWQGTRPDSINLLQEHTDDQGRVWLGMPVHYGLKTFQTMNGYDETGKVMPLVQDDRSIGYPHEFHQLPTPGLKGDENQAPFFDELYDQVTMRPVVLAQAGTGTGKTVAGLNTIARLGRSALVICPTKRIAFQWRRDATDPNILGLPEEAVGTIEGGKWDYEGKHITIALIHNLGDPDKLPEGFYEAFGTVIWDEAHILGARSFSQSLINIPARYKIGLTATPRRKDGCENIFLYHFGYPCVYYEGETMYAEAYVLNFEWPRRNKVNGLHPTARRRSLMLNEERNALCVRAIKRMYELGRHILVVSEELEHLQHVIGLCSEAGIPDIDLGLFTGFYIDGDGKQVKIQNKDLTWVCENCRVLFTTYKMSQVGVDIERLDAGIDILPRSEGEQMIGRIRRPLEGKPVPMWVTIRDNNIWCLVESTRSRLRDYQASNVKVVEDGKKTFG